MHIKNFIILLALFFSQLLFAEDLNDYKYENYKASAVEISFSSILPKMRAEMYDGKEISGLMYKPDGSGPFEAVVMLHGAGGIFPYQLDWARQLRDEGYVVLFVDSYCKRKFLCEHDSPDNDPKRREAVNRWKDITPPQRGADAFGAFEYLVQQNFVKKDKISLMGFSWGATAGLMSIDPRMKKLFSPTKGGFHSLIAVYPNSKYWTEMGRMWRRIADVNITIPTLMLAGEKDELESIDVYKELQQLAEKNTYPLTVVLYPDSYRKFDEKREKHSVTVNNITLTKAYNKKAHEDSIKQVFSFLSN
jgi:dienelactone hydrolase